MQRNPSGPKQSLGICRRTLFQALLGATCVAGMLVPASLFAQGTTANLGGTVTDTTGAVIPNAQILVKNENSTDQRRSKSNGSGVFSFSALPTGTYDVTITAPGFTGFEQKGIHLDPGDSRSVRDIHLAPGGVNAVVNVSSAAGTISTDSGEQSSLISAEEIKHLSVEGRDVTELLKILPGFAISNGGSGTPNNVQYDPSQVNPTGALGQYAANGTPLNGTALLSDGIDITDPGAFGGALQNINYEQVAEVKVQTSSFTADTAHGPIVINAVGKSGGDKYHGSLYTFGRISQLNSNDWISNYTNQSKPNDRYIYPGGTIGGPILIPGTNFNKGRHLTFFAGAEDYAQRNVYAYGNASAATLTALVPTAAMRTGDFSQAQVQQYVGSQYYVEPNGAACPYLSGGVATNNPNLPTNGPDQNICRVPQTAPDGSPLINGNIGNYLDPLGKIILNEMPLPNTTSTGTYNWITTNLINDDLWQARGRVDYDPSDKNQIFGVYSIEKGSSGVPQNEYYSARGNLGGINVPGGGLVSTFVSHIASLNFTHIFNSSLTNEFFAAGAYANQDFVAKTQSAIANNPYQGVYNNGSTVQPTLEDYGNDGLPLLRTPDTSFGGIFAKKQIRIAGDNLTKVIGQHTIRAGAFYQWDNNPQVAPFINTNGTINAYYIGETFNDPVQGTVHSTGIVNSGQGGNYLADVAEGQIFQYNQTNIAPEPNLYFYTLAGYAQDHWRVSPRLTVDGGLRIEHITPWQDTHNIGLSTFTAAAYAAGTNPTLPGVQWHANNKSIPNGGRPTRWGFLEPRVGFAWDVHGSGNTIVRGGFGIYRAHDSYNDATNEGNTTLGLRTYTVQGPLLISSVSSFQGKANAPGGFVPDSSVYAFDPTDDEEPRVRTYNLAVDQQFPHRFLLEIAYVGNVSDKLMNDGSTQTTTLDNINALHIGALFAPQPNSRPDTAATAGTVYPVFAPPSNAANSSVGGLDQAHIDTYKPFPLYNAVYVPEHNTYSNYNGLQIGLTHQQGKANLSVNYTFSKALGILGIGGAATYGYPGDPFNYRNDYSNLPFDRRDIFNAAYSYAFGNLVQNKLLGEVTNGWEFSGITQYQSGANLQSTVSPNFLLQGNLTAGLGTVANVAGTNNTSTCTVKNPTPTSTCTVPISNVNILGTADVDLMPTVVGNPEAKTGKQQFINAAAFSLPALGTNGPYKYGFLPGPGFFDTDLTLAKSFAVTKGSNIQFRAAAFNFINHANNSFTPVNVNNYTMNFNPATSTSVNQGLTSSAIQNQSSFGYAPLKQGRRVMELGLRYDF